VTTPLSLGAINLEAEDPTRLAAFWASPIAATPVPTGDSVYRPAAGSSGLPMFVRPLAGARPERQMVHVDLTVPWGCARGEVERIVELGGLHRRDVLDEVPYVQWSTLADPEGNLFGIAEHPPTDTTD
jgi:hypothetical protein